MKLNSRNAIDAEMLKKIRVGYQSPYGFRALEVISIQHPAGNWATDMSAIEIYCYNKNGERLYHASGLPVTVNLLLKANEVIIDEVVSEDSSSYPSKPEKAFVRSVFENALKKEGLSFRKKIALRIGLFLFDLELHAIERGLK